MIARVNEYDEAEMFDLDVNIEILLEVEEILKSEYDVDLFKIEDKEVASDYIMLALVNIIGNLNFSLLIGEEFYEIETKDIPEKLKKMEDILRGDAKDSDLMVKIPLYIVGYMQTNESGLVWFTFNDLVSIKGKLIEDGYEALATPF